MMKILKHSLVRVLGMGLIAITHSGHAMESDEFETRMPIAEPTEICFIQTMKTGNLDNMVLQHLLLVPSEHHGKHGKVFVGARLASQPDRTWLTASGDEFWDVSGSENYRGPAPYSNSGILKPVIPIRVFSKPVNLASYDQEGQIWVGYGLYEPIREFDKYNESVQAAYDEMIASGRFRKIWTAGEWPETQMHNLVDICLKTEEVIKTDYSKRVVSQPYCPITSTSTSCWSFGEVNVLDPEE